MRSAVVTQLEVSSTILMPGVYDSMVGRGIGWEEIDEAGTSSPENKGG